jgi:hypothetical protein
MFFLVVAIGSFKMQVLIETMVSVEHTSPAES